MPLPNFFKSHRDPSFASLTGMWVLLLCLGSIVPLHAATLRVPEDYPAIQLAIGAATSGDTILVGPGTYDENLNTQGKQLALLGSGAAVTIVDGGSRDRVLLISGGGTVQGFTLRHGRALTGAGIRIDGPAQITVRDNIIEDNIAGYVDVGAGGGIYLSDLPTNALITDNVIAYNYAGDSGGGIRDFTSKFGSEFRNNVIKGNGCHVGGGGVRLGSAKLVGNLILENWSDSFGGGIYGGGDEIRNNTIVGNFLNNPFPNGGGMRLMARPLVTNNIVAGNYGGGINVVGEGFFTPRLECNDSWGNKGGDFLLFQGADTTGARNFSADPLFCDPRMQDFRIDPSSPCAAEGSSGCGLIGAYPIGRECSVTVTRRFTWGQLKRLYR